MDRLFRVSVEVTVDDDEPTNPEHEAEVVVRAIEDARDQLMRWQVTDDHGVDVEVDELL